MPEPRVPQPGEMIDHRFRVRREIARGGMAVVLEAEHVHLGRRVALKTVDQSLVEAPMLGERLLREARALELARSPHVVDVLDAGTDGAIPYVALEMLDGRALDAVLIARAKLPLESTVALTLEVCDALETVHRAGLVHRDVKPSNIFVTRSRAGREQVKLIDFGVAAFVSTAEAPAKLTRMGDRIGTLDYMAPEQLLADVVDSRADLFALALVFYECLMGVLPIAGGTRALVRALVAGSPLPSLSSAVGRPCDALDRWMKRALQRDPADRHASATEMASELVEATGIRGGALGVLEAAPPPSVETGRPRRHFARAPYVAPIRVVAADGAVRDGQTADLSEGGLLALLADPVELGARVTLRVGLPVSGRVVALSAVARWKREARHRQAIGFEFAAPGPEAADEIRRFVEFTTAPAAVAPPTMLPSVR